MQVLCDCESQVHFCDNEYIVDDTGGQARLLRSFAECATIARLQSTPSLLCEVQLFWSFLA